MTPDERINAAWANLFVGCEPSVELRQLWRDTISAAVEAEREACAGLARKVRFGTSNEWIRQTSSDVEALILARSTAKE